MKDWKLEYHEGYFAAGNNIPFDETKSAYWQEGYWDGYASLYGNDEEADKLLKEILK